MKTLELFNVGDGWCHGPLFKVNIKRPARKTLFKTGWMRRRVEYARTPAWADKAAIRAIYRECKKMNQRDGARTWAVDHIVPLNHPLVCGLHVANNLRIVPYIVNQAKSNTWPEDQQPSLF